MIFGEQSIIEGIKKRNEERRVLWLATDAQQPEPSLALRCLKPVALYSCF